MNFQPQIVNCQSCHNHAGCIYQKHQYMTIVFNCINIMTSSPQFIPFLSFPGEVFHQGTRKILCLSALVDSCYTHKLPQLFQVQTLCTQTKRHASRTLYSSINLQAFKEKLLSYWPQKSITAS